MASQKSVPIAVIGMGCRFPGTAKGTEAFWSLLAEGRHGWSGVPETRFNEKSFYHPDPGAPGAINQKGGHFLDQDISEFDANFFGMSPLEAESLDPQQRVVLEATWEAIENAGIPMENFRGSETAVFLAMFCHDYEHLIMKDPLTFNMFHNTGAAKTILSNRISYVFDLRGPSVLLDTGCSGSLVAVNSACQSLASGESDMALAGGVTLIFSPDNMAVISSGGLLNSEGRCFSFDERGAGFGRGEGVGIVALKRLDDALRDGDNVRAIIRASGANQDGRTNGITLPSQFAQERLVQKLFQNLPFEPKDIQYAEAHGTGTKAGDMLEMQAIKNVFCDGRSLETPLILGTSKPNIGHSEAAAGVAGLIKTIMCLEKGQIPPNILLEKYKPTLKPDEWNLKITRQLMRWPVTTGSRKAVVNSFGSGGTNAMVVLESLRSFSDDPSLENSSNVILSNDGPLFKGVRTMRVDVTISNEIHDDGSDTTETDTLSSKSAEHTNDTSSTGNTAEATANTFNDGNVVPPNDLKEDSSGILDQEESAYVVRKKFIEIEPTVGDAKKDINELLIKVTPIRNYLEFPNKEAVVEISSPQNESKESLGSVPRLFILSARSEYSAVKGIEDLQSYLETHPNTELDDLSYTLTSRRSKFQWRTSVTASGIANLKEVLGSKESLPVNGSSQDVNVFVFTGQGAQWARMGYELLSTDTDFAKSIIKSDTFLKELGASWSLLKELSRPSDSTKLNDSKFGQPSSTAIQLAIIDLLKSWNIQPTAVVGHSSGEIAAAYAAGAITHETAIRVAYYRSFLSDAAKKQATYQGAMMAVGLGEADVKAYIDKITSATVVVACINSPSSTTVSGDAPAVAELNEALIADGVFARKLQVDTAYHSHHMALVKNEYMDRLAGLVSSPVSPKIRLFSSVTGEEKSGGFGASYWVDNLVGQVRFSDAIQRLYQEIGQGPVKFIEVGPHKALAGPIRQTMTTIKVDAYTYIPTIVRGEDSRISLLETASTIFKAGGNLDTGAVASLAITKTSPELLRDLPKYHWNHTVTNWNESRLSRAHRTRRHPHHDLLGSRVLTSPDSQPSWRNIFRTDTLPWLRDHVIDSFVVFPAAGYMAMAIEAIKQLSEDQQPSRTPLGYHLENISFKKALTIPVDAKGIETILTFRRAAVSTSFEFIVSSMSEQGIWQENCDGIISISFKPELSINEVEQSKEADLHIQAQIEHLLQAQEGCTKTISQTELYDQMAVIGNNYGPSFAVIQDLKVAECQSLNRIIIPDIASNMPSQFQQPHVIHPAPLDAIIQTYIPIFQQHSVPGSTMPVRLGDVFVSADVSSRPGEKLEAVCDLHNTLSFSTEFSTIAFQNDSTGTPQPVVTISGGEARIVGSSEELKSKPENENIFTIDFGLDISSVTPARLESVVIPLQSDEAGMTYAEKVAVTDSACARYIDWAVTEIEEKGLTVVHDNRVHLYAWMTRFVNSDEGKALIQESPQTEEELHQVLSRLGVEGETILRMGSKMRHILTGEIDALNLFLEDNLLWRVYHADTCARPNRYLADYLKILTTQRRNLRILEIGAGTGGTTRHLFDTCSPNGEVFCSEYVYTDISPGFFETARTSTLKEWADMLTFQTLDLEKDLIKQGFGENSFDFIVAANVVHATRSLNSSLSSLRRLLKPGGQLGLVEVTKVTPFLNMTFGSIDGWWAGVEEGRIDSPFQSADEWNGHLLKTSFSGVDLVAYDLPEPERYAAFMVSTAIVDVSAVTETPIHMLSILPAEHPVKSLGTELSKALTKKACSPVDGEWVLHDENESGTYVILDSADSLFFEYATSGQFASLSSLLNTGATIYWVSFADGSASIAPENSLATGLARTARNENDRLKIFTLDIQDPLPENKEKILQLVSEHIARTNTKLLTGQSIEPELMYRKGELHFQRLVTHPDLYKALLAKPEESEKETALFHQDARVLRAHVERPGVLSSLTFVDQEFGELEPDEVEVQSFAWGVNTRDLAIILGQAKPGQQMVGEGAGIVTRVGSDFESTYKVGDRVAVLSGTPYASRTRAKGYLVYPVPENIPLTNAASIPTAFVTAYYSLVDIANLQSGQTVLIHEASTDLGLAAIQIARKIGALIFATVNSSSKRKLLQEQGVPDSNIFSSLTTDFALGIKRLTHGKGVDVLLNCLSGDALPASWSCMATLGTFIEAGMTENNRSNQLSTLAFDKNVRFVSVDITVLAGARPKYMQELLKRVFARIEAEDLSTLPVTKFPINDVEKSFKTIQSVDHVGKVVLEADESTAVDARLQPFRLRTDATYIMAGGLGGFGKQVCRHLQSRGARNIIVLSRRTFLDDERSRIEAELAGESDVVVKILTCDILDTTAVKDAAAYIHSNLPPVKGLIQSAMLLVDRTLPQMSVDAFREGVGPKFHGTKNLSAAFGNDDLDFFISLSSVLGLLGSLGQANYVAGNVFQDMFSHSQVSAGRTNFVTLNFPLIQDTLPMTQEAINSLARQGCQNVSVAATLPLIDFAMSGRAQSHGFSQISLGLDPQPFIDLAKVGAQFPPLFGHVTAQSLSKRSQKDVKQSAEESISQASSPAEAEKLILQALQEKVSSLIALNSTELDVETAITNLGLDSLVAIELRNWIKNALQAPVQTSDIMDATSLRSLASFVLERSGLVKKGSSTTKQDVQDISVAQTSQVQAANWDDTTAKISIDLSDKDLPKYPLQPLEASSELFLSTMVHTGNEEERQQAHDAVEELLRPDGIGRRLHGRLEKLAENPNTGNWLADLYANGMWLKERNWHPRLHNFFGTIPASKMAHTQAERATIMSLAAFQYKLSLDNGTVPRDYQNEQPLCMESVYWLFNSNRTPVIGCDRVDRYPDNDYIVAIRNGHGFKISLRSEDGEVISHGKLKATFQAIIEQAPHEVSWVNILTTANRDEWAKVRSEIVALVPGNEQFVSTIEKSLFTICLEDESPATPNERATAFLLDDNRNRWLDKTLSFIVEANGESAMFCEHSMVDGTTFIGIITALTNATVDHVEIPDSVSSASIVPGIDYTYLPFSLPDALNPRITELRETYLDAVTGYTLQNYTFDTYGASYIRGQKLPPKSVFQVIVQLAIRLHFGYNPHTIDVVNQRHFQGGRLDSLNAATTEMVAFCSAAQGLSTGGKEHKKLFLEAVKSHARLVALLTRGKGWSRHLMALKEVLEPGEEAPTLLADPKYLRTKESRLVYTNFLDAGLSEMGNCWADREAIWSCVRVSDERVDFTIINGKGRTEEFVGYLEKAANLVKQIIDMPL